MNLNIAYLYPKSMNIYGDYGNILTLKKRCEWRNIHITIDKIEIGDNYITNRYDIIFAGGGQDDSQLRIKNDLLNKRNQIKKDVDRGIVGLLICGSYQLFGEYFKTFDKNKLKGINVLDIKTIASKQRKIGNIKIKTHLNINPKTLVGFENHSGNTFIRKNSNTIALGKVIQGFGNNGIDGFEGAIYNNIFGTYLHGSILPKNPHFADYLIQLALENKYQKKIILKPLNNKLELEAHNFIIKNR